jgi:transcriptional regulator with XRE-family HTH domain
MPKRKTTALEIEIGERIRTRRRQLRMTQTALGDKLGVTFQQIHKYESGKSRVPASQLRHVAGALDVHVGYFYGHDAAAGVDTAGGAPGIGPLTQRHATDLLECFQVMKAPQRNALLRIAKALAAASVHVPDHSHGGRSGADAASRPARRSMTGSFRPNREL